MHTSKVGCGVSAETDTIADTVTPWRPAAPSVVTTLTVHAAWLMPCKNRCLNPESISVGCAPAFLSLIRPFARSDTPASSLAWADRPPWASANPQIDKHQPSAYISAPRVRRTHLAQVAELVDALVSGTSGAIRGGSSPLLGTTCPHFAFKATMRAMAFRRQVYSGNFKRAKWPCSFRVSSVFQTIPRRGMRLRS